MGLADNLVGSSVGGFYLGITVVIAVVTYGFVRGSGLPIIGGNGGNGVTDVFGGT
jgi:hypothetical protein